MFSSVDDELNNIHFPVNIQSKDPDFQSDIFFSTCSFFHVFVKNDNVNNLPKLLTDYRYRCAIFLLFEFIHDMTTGPRLNLNLNLRMAIRLLADNGSI